MAVISADIAGTIVYPKQGTVEIEENLQGMGIARFTLLSIAGAYRPAREAAVTIYEDATVKFAGLIDSATEMGVGGEALSDIDLQVDCVSYRAYADWRHGISFAVPEGTTLEEAAEDIVAYLAIYGVTIHPSQATGPTLPLMSWAVAPISQIANDLTSLTGWVWDIDASKQFRFTVPGSTAAPYNIANDSLGDINVEPATTDYANRVMVLFGTGQHEVTDTFTGDGVTASFALRYAPLVAIRGYILVNGVAESFAVVDTGFNLAAVWLYYPTTGLITRQSGAPANGATIEVSYTVQFPSLVIRNDAVEQSTKPIREVIVTAPTVFDVDAAGEIADEWLPRYVQQARTVRYVHATSGLAVGQLQTIVATKRNFNASCLIQQVSLSYLDGGIPRYQVTAIEGSLLQNTWMDVYREWAEGGGGGGGVVASAPSSGSTGTSAVSPPANSVQFNRGGAFGGDAAFTYYESTDSLVCGNGSSITAALPQSCQVFGSNNHIAD